jgi:ATP-binding cassette subfamily B protein
VARSTRQNLRGGLALAWNASPRYFLLIAAIAAVAAALPPLEIWLGKLLVDRITVDKGDPVPVAIALGLAFGFQRALDVVRRNQQDLFAVRVERSVMKTFLAKAATVDVGHLDDPAWHDSATRARRDVNWLPSQLTFMSFELIASSMSMLGMIGLLSTMHPLLGVLMIVTVLPWITIQRRANRKMFELLSTTTPEHRERDYLATLLGQPEAAKEIRSFGLADHLLARYLTISDRNDRQRADLLGKSSLAAAASGLITAAAVATGYAFVAERGLVGTVTPGALVATFGAFAMVAMQAHMMSHQLGMLERHATFLSDYFTFLEVEPLVKVSPTPTPLPEKLDGVVIEGVHFTYPRGSAEALCGLDLEVKPGELVAIVGENGAGKTTIVNLLSRFYDPSQGRVLISGIDIRDVDPQVLRGRIGVLLQDFIKYQLTLRETVQLGRIERPGSDADLTAALVAARAKDFADNLDRRIGKLFDGGHDLSGGQWQRLAVARLIYRQADLWILDEPTSNLDPEAEAGIFAELKLQLAGRMAIVISHRFSTVRVADRIYVVEGGRVLEAGTHDELVAARGRYAELFELQAAGYR